MAFVAIKPAGGGLLTMAGVQVDSRDHPVLRDPAHDPEHPVCVLLEVLADHGREQLTGLLQLRLKLPPVEQQQHCVRASRSSQSHAGLPAEE